MDKKYLWWVLGAVALWYLFLRQRTSITGGANLGIATGNNALPGTQYPGYPPGQVPPGVSPIGPGGMLGPPPPVVVQPNDTAQILGGVGALIGGVGSAVGNLLGQGGISSYLGGGSGGGSGGSYNDSNASIGMGGGDWQIAGDSSGW